MADSSCLLDFAPDPGVSLIYKYVAFLFKFSVVVSNLALPWVENVYHRTQILSHLLQFAL